MLNNKKVIVLNVLDSKIDIINLQTKSLIQVNHDYLFDDVAQMTIQTFNEIKLFLVEEKGGFYDQRLRLSYYAYLRIKKDSKPVTQWQSKDKQWTYDHYIRKANNYSKFYGGSINMNKKYPSLTSISKDSPEGKLEKVTAVNTLDNDYGISNVIVNIGAIWQTLPNQYMIVAVTSKNWYKVKNKNGVTNNNFILDATPGNDKAVVRQTKFDFGVKADGFSFNDQIIDYFRLGGASVFHTFRYDKGEVLSTPIYYVNNETEEIIFTIQWKCNCCASNFFFPGWDASTIVQGYYLNGDVKEVSVAVKKIMNPTH